MTGPGPSAGSCGHFRLQVVDRIETDGAVVLGRMIDRFADLSGDRFALHLSCDAAREPGFPRHVAQRRPVLSLIDGPKNTAPA